MFTFTHAILIELSTSGQSQMMVINEDISLTGVDLLRGLAQSSESGGQVKS